MGTPWNHIKLSDYENHMKFDTVLQLQTLNRMMEAQLNAYNVHTAMILGVAGGNGLEHIDAKKYTAVYGVDVNPEYLQAVRERYPTLEGILQCLCLDLTADAAKLPAADLIIANLLIEYIGYESFQTVIAQVKPRYVSCGIQVNSNSGFVSTSPYIHSFDGLSSVLHQIETDGLIQAMRDAGCRHTSTTEYPLPNGKKLVQIDFES